MMDTPLPSNEDLLAFSDAIAWHEVEEKKRLFNSELETIAAETTDDSLPLDRLSEVVGLPVTAHYGIDDPGCGNVFVAEANGRQLVLGSVVSDRYRSGKTLAQSIVPYNLNPSVNHTNFHETDDSDTRIRALGAELELGLLHRDGSPPKEDEMQAYIQTYEAHAQRLGITPEVDREACQYQIEAHVAPGVGYHRTRAALDGIMAALAATSQSTGLITAIFSAYPTESDFRLTENPKVRTAVDLMVEVNAEFPQYGENLTQIKQRYHMDPAANCVETFRLQGCHIHMDLAGRSEGLGLLAFYTMLRSASAVANAAVLKGGPFVNGTCDAELVCTREYLRGVTVTGRNIDIPLSPHLITGDLDRYADLLKIERANAVARALLYDDSLGTPISAMHSLLGRLRPDLRSLKRICTIESTGMPVNVSASRQAAILADFEFTHALIEDYYRKYGVDLEPMYNDRILWSLIGPLSHDVFDEMHHRSDREGSDLVLKTAIGDELTLADFYEKKRLYMHQHLTDNARISPRDIDDVYTSLQRMLDPPSGTRAQTIEQYVYDYKLRSTGNWGQILRDAFVEEGGTPGDYNPEAVLRVVNRVHDAIHARYVQN
jgi:hypothetical protein